MNTVDKGSKFEKEIADLYKLMGYDVEINVPISGQQVDILASKKITGSGDYKLLIECKYKGNNKPAGNEDIQSIAGAYSIARNSNLVHNCIVVTNNHFSIAAKQAAKSAGIVLKTKQQLIEELIDFSTYFVELKEAYEQEFGIENNSWYIENKARKGNDKIENLDNYISNWLKTNTKKPIVIKGGYGTGKSSFCKHFAVKTIEENQGVIPIIIQLRDFQKSLKIESLIRDFLEKKCNSNSPRFDIFWRMYLEGKILIFFDGFDEMAARVDSTVIESNLVEIEKFSKKIGNVIVTCRPEYFVSEKEDVKVWSPKSDPIIDRMTNYDSIELDLWDKMQVRSYIEKKLKNQKENNSFSIQDFIDKIENVSSIQDISSRAVHLDLTIRILPDMVEKNIPLNRPNLYKTYIVKELAREVIKNKRLKIISDDDRLQLLKNIAYKNFINSSDELNFEIASNVIQQELNVKKHEIDSVTRDFLNRSFLSRNGDSYQFAHKSLGEFLIASKISDLIKKDDFSFLTNNSFSSAVAGITLEFFGGFYDFLTLVDKFKVKNGPKSHSYLEKIHFLTLSLSDALSSDIYNTDDYHNNEQFAFEGFAHDVLGRVGNINYLMNKREPDNDFPKIEEIQNKIQIIWNKLIDYFVWMNSFDSKFNNIKPVISEFNINELVHESIIQYSNFNIIVGGKCNHFSGDKIILSRIFDNLISNAIEELSNHENKEIKISISESYLKDKHQLKLEFTNKVHASKKNFISNFFDFGFTTKKKGQGIGLYIVKSMVSLHNGTIEVIQNKGNIIFKVTLLSLK